MCDELYYIIHMGQSESSKYFNPCFHFLGQFVEELVFQVLDGPVACQLLHKAFIDRSISVCPI